MTDYPTAVQAEQDAIVTLEATVWYAAHCPNHDQFCDVCPDCLVTPQNCPEHTPLEPGVSNPVGWCPACQALRPDSARIGPVFHQVTTAERAFGMLGLPVTLLNRFRRGRGRVLRVPWKGPYT